MNWIGFTTPSRSYFSYKRNNPEGRSQFERDHDRILFSTAFKRLSDKTQVLPIPKNYFVHNRMTHSMETSCIGRSIGQIIGIEISNLYNIEKEDVFFQFKIGEIIKSACLAHDIGNPPFGHSGEDALSEFYNNNSSILNGLDETAINDLKNFEGNAQGFRLLSNLENGLRLTANTLLAFSKYPRESIVKKYSNEDNRKRKDQKKYGFFQREKEIFQKIATEFRLQKLSGTDIAYARHPFAYMVEAADDICYLILDLEDAIRLKLIKIGMIKEVFLKIISNGKKTITLDFYDNLDDDNDRMSYLRAVAIHSLIYQVKDVFLKNIKKIENFEYIDSLINEISSINELIELKKITKQYVYRQ